jgi:hypothetical protein
MLADIQQEQQQQESQRRRQVWREARREVRNTKGFVDDSEETIVRVTSNQHRLILLLFLKLLYIYIKKKANHDNIEEAIRKTLYFWVDSE